jgi:hypothetical protein
MANHLISGLFSGLSLRALARAMGRVPTNELTATESASTLFRFFRSKHVRDLKLIFTTALFVLAVHLLSWHGCLPAARRRIRCECRSPHGER